MERRLSEDGLLFLFPSKGKRAVPSMTGHTGGDPENNSRGFWSMLSFSGWDPGVLGRIRIYLQVVNKYFYRYISAVGFQTEFVLKNPQPSTYSVIYELPRSPEA
jgi:hypothetical protein